MRAVLGPVLVAAALGAAAAVPAEAQGNYQQVVMNQLNNAASVLAQNGYSPIMQPIMGSLRNRTDQPQMLSLTGGRQFVIVGACDQDCSDMDLRIFGPDGTMLDEDVETDDRPVLEFTAPATGQYRLQVIMHTCTTEPCYWGVQVFGR